MRIILLSAAWLIVLIGAVTRPNVAIRSSFTVDSLGACQGISLIDGKLYAYGDRESGMIREFEWINHSMKYTGKQIKLTSGGEDVINHPTGIAHHEGMPTFIGNSIRLNKEGTQWKAILYQINWEGLKRTGTLDGNLISTIEDDACIQGARPEYVRYKGKLYVATSDYGQQRNEVRLYDPTILAKAARTSDPGVVFKKFSCGPWVQNLHWDDKHNILILIQNQIEGRKWRLTFLNLEESVNKGVADIIYTVDIGKEDELEGLSFTQTDAEAIAVTSSRKENVHFMDIRW